MIERDPMSRRSFVRASVGLVPLVAGGGLLAACGDSDSSTSSKGSGASGRSGKDVTFGFSHPYAEVPIVAKIKDLVSGVAKDKGWKVRLDETQAGELQDQLGTIDTWITQKVTALSVFPTEPSAFETQARRAAEAGIVWTTYAIPMETSAGGVLFPPELSGEVTGRATVEWIKANDPKAQVLILENTSGGVQRKRTDIPKKMIEDQTSAKIVAVQAAIEQVKGLQVTEDVLQSFPDVTVVVAHSDDGGLGAADAFRKAGRKDPSAVWIIGQDGSEDALTALHKGKTHFRASAALDINRLCREVVGVTARAIDRQWKPGGKQEYIKLAPTLIKAGDSTLAERFLTAYR